MNNATLEISIVVPLLNEEESLPELTDWITRVLEEHQLSFEVLMIDDGSTDNSWQVIQTLSQKDERLKGIRFNRNYGKSAALNVGFKSAKGRVVITMDADLQDSPDEVPELYRMIVEDKFDLVSGWKKKRYDPITKTVPTKLYNAATRLLSGIHLHDFNCGLKAYRNLVVKNIEVYGEMHRYIPVIAKWSGYGEIGEKVVEHRARKYGKTKFGLERFVNGLLDLLSITFVSRFRKKPMHFFGTWGIIAFLFGFSIAGWLIIEQFFNLFPTEYKSIVTDRPLFYLSLMAIIIGTQLFLAGFLAELITKGANQNDYVIAEKLRIE